MLGLLKRHEVEILLKAGHKRTEIARLTGVSPNSVRRIAGEGPITHFDDAAERRKRRIGRPGVLESFRKLITHTVGKQADMPSVEILRQVREAGYRGSKTALYALVASVRANKPDTKRKQAFEWMSAVQQGAISRSALEKCRRR